MEIRPITFLFLNLIIFGSNAQEMVTLNQKDDGFRGIWYFIGKTNNAYVHKYSGGLGTYPANHYPFSIYSAKVNKTFFCYGGASKDTKPSLLHEVAYFDHKTKSVSRPTIVLNKNTDDAHDNPVISIDKDGYIWLFSTSHGVNRPSYIHKSVKPFDIEKFELVKATYYKDGKQRPFDNFSYLQIYYDNENGFMGFMTHYDVGVLKYGTSKPRRTSAFITSKDGISWSELKDIGAIQEGHYQSSGYTKLPNGQVRYVTIFNYHPDTEKGAGLDFRANIYYLETTDFGQSWQNYKGENMDLPLKAALNPALVLDTQKDKKLAYINDLGFDEKGNPMFSYISSLGPEPGPENGPYELKTAYFNGQEWLYKKVTNVDHNYDFGSLYYINGQWRLLAPTGNVPFAYNTGGEVQLWKYATKKAKWELSNSLTKNSKTNHSYPRKPINYQADFQAFWADGNPRNASKSFFYISNNKGEVFQLPYQFKTQSIKLSKQ